MLEKFRENSGSTRKIFEETLKDFLKNRRMLEKFGKNLGNTQKIENDFELNRQGLHNPLL